MSYKEEIIVHLQLALRCSELEVTSVSESISEDTISTLELQRLPLVMAREVYQD